MLPQFVLFMALQAGSIAVPNPRSADLFEADGLLRVWALDRFDANSDGWLSLFEAQAAADEFRAMADRDRDGRVTVTEYRAARAFVGARHNVADLVSSPSK